MHHFIVVFEFIDESVFKIINTIKHSLDISFKGKYKLDVVLNGQGNESLKDYKILGAPALINTESHQVIYGNFTNKDYLKKALSHLP